MLLLSNTTRNFLDKYQEKKISLLAQLYYAAYSITTAGVASEQPGTLRNPPAWPEMKWWNLPQFKLIHTSHLWHDWFSFRVLKYGIVFLPFFAVVTANVYSLALPGNGKKLTCRRTAEMNTDEIWKCNFPSVNQLLKVDPSHQPGRREVRSSSAPGFHLMGRPASLIKILGADKSLDGVRRRSDCSRNILLYFSMCYW